jgi:ribosomal protein S18 acetylase RimI-like enzyme
VKGLRLRDAVPGDRRAVFDFCKATWPGYGDYIPRVWRNWIGDAGGRLIVAEMEGRAVGIAKITEFSPGEIWLEGLRVDPEFRGHGIGRVLNDEVLRTVKRMKPRAARFCTGSTNKAPRLMAEREGFKVAAHLRYYWQKSRRARLRGDLARKGDIEALHDFILNSRSLRLTSGLIGEGWIFREFSRELLGRYVKERRVIVVRKPQGFAGVAIYPYEENDRTVTLGFVDGDPSSIKTLARNCMYLAAAHAIPFCSVSVPTRGYARIIEEAGYQRKGSMGQIVYELRGSAGKAPSVAKPR